MLAGSRVLVVFADNCCTDFPGGLSRFASLNRVAENGVNGWLVVRRPEKGGHRAGVALAEIMGVMPERIADADGDLGLLSGFESGPSGQVPMEERYGGFKVRIVSNQPAALGLEKSLGVACRLVDTRPSEEDDSIPVLAEEILKELQGDFGSSAEMVVVHYDASVDQSCMKAGEDCVEKRQASTRRCMEVLDMVLERQCDDIRADVLQGVIVCNKNPDGSWIETDTECKDMPAWERKLRPMQSSCVHNGIQLSTEAGMAQSLMYALYHPQGTRCDAVTALEIDQMRQKGANGGSLAQHLMLEIAFLMGHMPKYGA